MTHLAPGSRSAIFSRTVMFLGMLLLVVVPTFSASHNQSKSAAQLKTSGSAFSVTTQSKINSVEFAAADKSATGKGIVIGIFDSGINLDNPAFIEDGVSRVVSQSCVGYSSEVNPCNTEEGRQAHSMCTTTDIGCFHGISVAGFAAGKTNKVTLNGERVDVGGVAPHAQISYVRDAMTKDGSIEYDDYVDALNKFVNDVKSGSPYAPDVVNLSLGFPRDSYVDCEQDNASKRAIDFLVNSGVVVVAASGNESDKRKIAYPACLENVIAVGSSVSTTRDGVVSEQVSGFSNMSNDIDLVAPGESQWALLPENSRFVTVAGTSFSAPLVAGTVALLKETNPTLSPREIRDLLVETGDIVSDPKTGQTFRRLNVGNAVARVTTQSAAEASKNTVETSARRVVVESQAASKVVVPPVKANSVVKTGDVTLAQRLRLVSGKESQSLTPLWVIVSLVVLTGVYLRFKSRRKQESPYPILVEQPRYLTKTTWGR